MKISLCGIIVRLIITAISCTDRSAEKKELKLWFSQPANGTIPDHPDRWKEAPEWLKAPPLGNGSLGLMVFGDVNHEWIQLNEESIWSGSPDDNNNPEPFDSHAKIRQLPFAGKYSRELDPGDAVVRVGYQQHGVSFSREIFTSLPDQVMVGRFTANRPGEVSFACHPHYPRSGPQEG